MALVPNLLAAFIFNLLHSAFGHLLYVHACRWAAPFRQTINLALLEIQATALSNLATPNNSNSSTAAGADWSSSNGTSAPAAHQHEQAGHGDGRTYSACSDAGESAVAARKVLRTTYVW